MSHVRAARSSAWTLNSSDKPEPTSGRASFVASSRTPASIRSTGEPPNVATTPWARRARGFHGAHEDVPRVRSNPCRSLEIEQDEVRDLRRKLREVRVNGRDELRRLRRCESSMNGHKEDSRIGLLANLEHSLRLRHGTFSVD